MIGHKFGKALGCFSFNPVGSSSGKESDFLFCSINIVGYNFAYLHYVFYLFIYMNELVITNYSCYRLSWEKINNFHDLLNKYHNALLFLPNHCAHI